MLADWPCRIRHSPLKHSTNHFYENIIKSINQTARYGSDWLPESTLTVQAKATTFAGVYHNLELVTVAKNLNVLKCSFVLGAILYLLSTGRHSMTPQDAISQLC